MKAIGIVLAGGNNRMMRELTNKRAIASMPVAGSYRAIDFALSNMSNSHIQKVAVITQYNARSLNEHLSSSKWWDFGRKQGGLYVFTPTITAESSSWYRGTADSLYQNIDFLKSSHEPYVVIASGDGIYKLDYNKILQYHIEKKADVTVVVKKLDNRADIGRYGVVAITDEGRITDIDEKPLETNLSTVSTGIYVVRRRLLIELLEKAAEEDRYDFVRDILVRYRNIKKIYGYMLDTYWNNISSVDSYYKTNMDFLKPEIRNYFFKQYPDIYSKVDDLPPAKYNVGAKVENSLISSGCIVNGTVEDSVIFKKSFIGSGVRYDLLQYESKDANINRAAAEYTRELIGNHVSGRLKVAPEHTSDRVLTIMRKPSFLQFQQFKRTFDKLNRELNLKQQLIPYFISSHPGCTEEDMAELAVITKNLNFHLEQVQDFTPTPMTMATEAYYTGYHPYTLEPVYTARNPKQKLAQRQFFFWYQPEYRKQIIEELRKMGRKDLIDKLYGK